MSGVVKKRNTIETITENRSIQFHTDRYQDIYNLPLPQRCESLHFEKKETRKSIK